MALSMSKRYINYDATIKHLLTYTCVKFENIV